MGNISRHATTSLRPGTKLTLHKAVSIALRNSPDIAVSRLRVIEARAQTSAAKSGHWPSLVASASYYRFLDPQRLMPFRGQGEVGVFTRNVAAGQLQLTLPLFAGGRVVSEVRAAKLLRLAASRRLARTRQELVFNVTSAYFAILGQRKTIGALVFAKKALEKHREFLVASIARKKTAPVELLRLDVRLADLRQALVRERSTLAAQRQLLHALLGLAGKTPRFTLVPLRRDRGREPKPEVERAWRNRADVRAARAELAASTRQVDKELAGYWPSLSLVGAYGFKSDLWTTVEDVGSLGLTLRIPLFDGLATQAKVRVARARAGMAAASLRKLLLQVRLEIRTAELEIRSAAARMRATSLAIRQARVGLRIERDKHRVGRSTLTDVLDAQAALLQAEATHYQAWTLWNVARARLELAQGEESR